jgi:replicative superfamily II helicase
LIELFQLMVVQVYQSDQNVVVSAPTGAGKTVSGMLRALARWTATKVVHTRKVLFELALLRMLTSSATAQAKAVYLVSFVHAMEMRHTLVLKGPIDV